MNDKTLVEPSNDEQSQWPEATEAYVRDLEEINEAQATRIEALKAALLPFVSKCDYIEDLELSDDDYVECCPFQAVHYRRAKQALEGE